MHAIKHQMFSRLLVPGRMDIRCLVRDTRVRRPPGRCVRMSSRTRSAVRFLQVGERGAERPVVQVDDQQGAVTTYDLSGVTERIDGAFLAADGLARARQLVADGSLPQVRVDGQRTGSPIARPQAVLCIGMNYAAYAAESGSAPPELPVLFL